MKVTPWEVKGNIDYDKLIKKFGLKSFKKLPKELEKSPLFRRGIIYANRDFDRILESIEKKKPFVMMTGLMPSGKFHFGHKLVADQIIFYQKLGAKVYIAVADIEAYNSRNTNMKELKEVAIKEYLPNYNMHLLFSHPLTFLIGNKNHIFWDLVQVLCSLLNIL
jgi:tryptophanyl-tRNA synthetase